MAANGTDGQRLSKDRPDGILYDTGVDPRLLLPGLRGFYDMVVPLSWPLIRFAVSLPLLIRAYGKVLAGPEKIAPAFTAVGLSHPVFWAIVSTWTESLGGIGLLLGLFTRFFGAAIAIEMAYITFGLYWGNGFSWLGRGYEYTLMWGLICFAIALRGGGPFSVDRLLRREL